MKRVKTFAGDEFSFANVFNANREAYDGLMSKWGARAKIWRLVGIHFAFELISLLFRLAPA
ncbi:hypothetical protein [Paraburkholderia sp. J67]|uniref:hypothetical protein n=1 Tax=Paraburkholderia sp. J67 TaxID=2805435 RepID=UPI002ABD73BF|nr:hypothetical protein [Paraburkholderia sp. J67]